MTKQGGADMAVTQDGVASARVLPPAPAPPQRLVSLDAYRGFTMLWMVTGGLGTAYLLNDPSWHWLADQLRHRDWVGCTFWDLIQPSFLFIVGVAMPFSFGRRREQGETWGQQFIHVVRRSLLLIAIGVFLDCYAENRLFFQLLRVLQQIAIGYFLAFLVMHLGPRWQLAFAILLLAGHTAAYEIYAWAHGVPAWQMGANVGRAIDDLLGLPPSSGGYVTFNAMSSAATILLGVLCGELLRGARPAGQKFGIMVAAGFACLALGLVISGGAGAFPHLVVVPMVKRLWTASFAIYAAGWTFLALAAFYAIIDLQGWRRWSFPLVVVGMNSIAIYVIAGVFASNIRRSVELFVPAPPRSAPDARLILIAVLVVAVQWLACWWLYRRRIFFKV
jgi:predicted acyltransferase